MNFYEQQVAYNVYESKDFSLGHKSSCRFMASYQKP